LQPGFHSGTVPQLFARLREAERQAMQTRNWQRARLYRHEVEEMEAALGRFLEREVVALPVPPAGVEVQPVEGTVAH